METEQRIRDLAAQGFHGSEIARQLGISRQRVSYIVRRDQIALKRVPYGFGESPYRTIVPKARVITGGIAQPISSSVAGSIAELLAAADLMARGWQVYLPLIGSRGHDLIAAQGALLMTVEVRSAHRNKTGRLIYAKKPGCVSTHYALVVTGEPVIYDPPLE